jgi:endonuclease/exonuclease/phosphatase family metal-dependent hydrolase
MKKISVFISLFLLSVATILPLAGQSGTNQSFNLMTYNIRLNSSMDGVNAWPLRKDKVTGLIRFHEADIFDVQEAVTLQMKDLAAAFPDFDNVGVGRDDGKEAGEYMAIFYRKERFQKINDGMFWLNEKTTQPGKGWDASYNRTCTWIKLKDKVTGKSFYVFNTHLDNNGAVAREEGARLILKKMKEINSEGLPLIFTGDFNSKKEEAPIQAILKELKDSRELSLTSPYGPAITSNGFAVGAMTMSIDFIFVNDKVTIYRHGVLSDSFPSDETPPKYYYPSDHLPVMVEVLLK